MIYMGVDPSYAATGVVVLEAPDKRMAKPPVKILHETTVNAPGETGLSACSTQAAELISVITEYGVQHAVIEGYAFAPKSTHTLVKLVELGTVLRYFMRQHGVSLSVCAPSTLKKFVLGTGKGTKSQMLKATYKKWKADFDDDNIADAYALARIGLAQAGRAGTLSQYEIESVSKLQPTG